MTQHLPGRPSGLPTDVALLAGLFAASGVVHLVKPEVYRPLVPSFVPAETEVVLGAGLAELACAAGLFVPATRRAAGAAGAAVLVGVFPGNVKMAVDSLRTGGTALRVAAFARLPLQVPLIRAALRAARG